MKKVYLVRHGETFHNQANLVQGGNTLLNELGEKQAGLVAQRLLKLDFKHLVVSDYERTKQTAKPALEQIEIKPDYNPLFREVRNPSSLFDQSRLSDEYLRFRETQYEKLATDPTWHHSDEENFTDVVKRAKQALEYLKTLEGDIVVISHGHFIRYVVALVAVNMELDGSLWQKMTHSFRAVNTGITTLEYNKETNHWQILTFNDIAHFAE